MNLKALAEWIGLLRSGKYRQAFYDWYESNNPSSNTKCALGVACHHFDRPYCFVALEDFLDIGENVLTKIADFNDEYWTFEQIANLLEAYMLYKIDDDDIERIQEYDDFMALIDPPLISTNH